MKNRTIITFTLAFFLAFSMGHAIEDTNLSNNDMLVTVDVVDTRTINLTFVRVDNANDFNQIVRESLNFINDTFPVATDSILHSSNFVYQTSLEERTDLKKFLYNLEVFNTFSANIEETIGVLPRDWFGDNRRGWAYFTPGKGSDVDAVIIESVGNEQIAAHELGHVVGGLCEEYDSGNWSFQDDYSFFRSCPNGDDPDLAGRQLDTDCISNGCPVTIPNIVSPEVSAQSSVPSEVTRYNFMGDADNPDPWISEESYNHLLDKLESNFFTSIETFLIGGSIDKSTDTVELFPAYELGARNIEISNLTSIGNYTIETFDENNNTIFYMNFTPSFLDGSFNGSVIEGNTSYFLFVINNTINNTRVEVRSNGTLKASLDRTNNRPTINITYPLGGELLTNDFNVTWNSSDLDNDTLNYAILVSPDNGSSYTTLEVDYNYTTYNINPNDFIYSEQYLFKVLVTDGMNTEEDLSNTFTMGLVPPTLAVNVKAENDTYTNNQFVNISYQELMTPVYSTEMTFNNVSAENMTFAASETVIRYLYLPKSVNVTRATLDIHGYGVQE